MIPTSQHSILVLEDDSLFLEMVCDILSDEGYSVTGVGTSKEALAAVRNRSYSLFLCDAVLQEKNDGIDAYLLLKEWQPELSCLMMTGASRRVLDLILRTTEAGIYDILEKPFRGEDLLRASHEAIQREERKADTQSLFQQLLEIKKKKDIF